MEHKLYRIAIVTFSINDTSGCGKKAGGGAVVTDTLISELSKNPEIDLTVIAVQNWCSDKTNFKTVILGQEQYVTLEKFMLLADEVIAKEKFDAVITSSIDALCENNFLQCHSFKYRCKSKIPFVQKFKEYLLKIKIDFQNDIFSHRTDKTKFFAVSQRIKDDYAENLGIKEGNITVVYPGRPVIYETLPEPEKKEAPVFGIVAGTSINKGGHIFMLAAGILNVLKRNFKIKIIFPKYEKDFLMKLIVNVFGLKNKTEFLPKLDEMSGFYREIDYAVMPSLNEAFGLVALEAASYGKPSVISSTAGCSEIFSEKDSFVYNRKSFLAFVKTLDKTVKIYDSDFDSYKQYSKNAWELSKEYTDKNFAAHVLAKVIEDIEKQKSI